jgi:hypothetical protein
VSYLHRATISHKPSDGPDSHTTIAHGLPSIKRFFLKPTRRHFIRSTSSISIATLANMVWTVRSSFSDK